MTSKQKELVKAALYGATVGTVALLPIFFFDSVWSFLDSGFGYVYIAYIIGFSAALKRIGFDAHDHLVLFSIIFIVFNVSLFVGERSLTFQWDRRKVLIVYAGIFGLMLAFASVLSLVNVVY